MDTTTLITDDYTESFNITSTDSSYLVTEVLNNISSTSQYTEEDMRAYRYYQNIADIIWRYVPGFLICIGIIGNTLSALVMTRPSLKRNVSSLFFTVLAFVDTLSLLTGLMRYWVMGLIDIDVRENSDASCKVHLFLVYWVLDYSGWILALVAAERCLAANLPHVYKQSCTKFKAGISLVITAIILAGVNCHYLFGFELRLGKPAGEEKMICTNKPQFTYYQNNVFPWIDLIFYCMGPFICILICNVSIAIRVLRSKVTTDQKTNNRLSSMTAILICVSIFYIMWTLPVAVYLISQNFWLENSTMAFYGKMQVFFAVATTLSFLNNSMNFFLYCISGPRFRKELMNMFSCLKAPASPHESTASGL